MDSHLFEGKNVMKTLKNSIKRCGKYPGEDWEIDFTHMPKANGYSCLQVWVGTFTGWIEAFPCHSEQAKKVIKNLTHEIIPKFGLHGAFRLTMAPPLKLL